MQKMRRNVDLVFEMRDFWFKMRYSVAKQTSNNLE